MAYTAPDPVPYQSVVYPIQTTSIAVKRGDGTTAGGGASPTSIGTFLCENINVTRPATAIDRKGIYGEGKGEPTIIREPLTWSSKVQIDASTTNTIRPGDYFEESVDVDTATVATTKVRFVVVTCTHDRTAGTPWTFNLDCVEDMPHSTQYGGS